LEENEGQNQIEVLERKLQEMMDSITKLRTEHERARRQALQQAHERDQVESSLARINGALLSLRNESNLFLASIQRVQTHVAQNSNLFQ